MLQNSRGAHHCLMAAVACCRGHCLKLMLKLDQRLFSFSTLSSTCCIFSDLLLHNTGWTPELFFAGPAVSAAEALLMIHATLKFLKRCLKLRALCF